MSTSPVVAAAAAAADAVAPTTTPNENENEDQQQQQQQQEPQLPTFEPLFTLLTNTTSNTTVHPRVQYLFSDDDPSTLAPSSTSRAIVVDLVPSSTNNSSSTDKQKQWEVNYASSLTPSFAVTGTALDPTTLTLRLDGVEREPVPERNKGHESGSEDPDALVEEFRRRMGIMSRIVSEADRRDAVVEHDEPAVEQPKPEANEEDASPGGS
ncbi:uncharacterized protein F5Z01DRAFT_651005 [Emericellopsis atlantica]|uniref:Uncharacterized protein n=1 Tax=Emericellopsis atlantica TaxID=2614577 RepID=A0A9P8CST4_9HYPO|nr:uncharacterized protein F5Z01DRAFT_651005 [Emericellopsis atlantica]KAG9256081.1 hypothetical protein F5Z01DRAFT_651005 [Emericellopsis atlantica]